MNKYHSAGIITCEICKNDMTKDNHSILLKCKNSLCLKCYNNMMETKSKCPFDKTHDHLKEPKVINIAFKNFISEEGNINNNPKHFLPKIKPISELNNEKFIYKGNLKDNKPFGEGKLIYNGIGIFKGKFNGDYHKGKGEILYDDGSSYKGEWENFKKQNYGVFTFQNFDRYEGEFQNDLFEGKGKLYLNDKGLIYEGFWRYGKKCGEFNIYNEFGELIKKENYDN